MAQSAVAFLLTKLGSLIEEELKSLDTDPEIQAWVNQVRDVAHDTDDVLDEFMLRFAHRHHHHRYQSQSHRYDRRGNAFLLEEGDLVGIDKPKQLINRVLDDADSQLKVISVVGMGGLGKTTLIKKVYDDIEGKRLFQNDVWITVSQSFKIEV
ncbi:hypothetical protein CsSME_00049590 [Camellia sinensis var. sinensis]